jgi:hypothetical protein
VDGYAVLLILDTVKRSYFASFLAFLRKLTVNRAPVCHVSVIFCANICTHYEHNISRKKFCNFLAISYVFEK